MKPSSPNLFPTVESLSNYLAPRLPPNSLSLWGSSPGTKNIHNLFLELSQGETTLTNTTPPVRTVNVVTVRVINRVYHNKVLIESHQEMSNGEIRQRSRSLSEKMKPNETVECAVIRAVKEELGAELEKVVEGSYKKKVEERVSISYPGLPACYILHSVDALVKGIPEEEEVFSTEEDEVENYSTSEVEAAEKAVFVKKHFWKWIDKTDQK